MSCQASAIVHGHDGIHRGRRVHPAAQLLAKTVMSAPGGQICAIHTIAQQVTALQLAQAAALALSSEGLAGWLPAKSQRLRRALHTLALAQRPRGATTLRTAAHLVVRLPTRAWPRCSGDVTRGRHALAISLLSSHPRGYQAACKRRHPAFSGVGQPQFELPHEAR